MKILQARIRNYSSFEDSGDLVFDPKMNLILGQNNSGKSGLLRALVMPLDDNRHRNEDRYQAERLSKPTVDLDIAMSGRELETGMLQRGGEFKFPTAQIQIELVRDQVSGFLNSREIRFKVFAQPSAEFEPRQYPADDRVAHLPYAALLQAQNGAVQATGVLNGQHDTLSQPVWQTYSENTFYFTAQRYSVGKCGWGRQEKLNPNANNLAAVLHLLEAEKRTIFNKLIEHA